MIEVDGPIHQHKVQAIYDAYRDKVFNRRDIDVLRIRNDMVLNHTKGPGKD